MEDITNNSILDKVMAASEEEELESFNPVEIVAKFFAELPSREQDILRRRFGLHGKGNETLEKIGASYKVTRERVRQIENAAIKHIKGFNKFEESIKPVELVVLGALEKHGGIMAESHMLSYLLELEDSEDAVAKHLLFLLNKLSSSRLIFENKKGFSPSWRVDFVDWDKVEQTVDQMVQILEVEGKPLNEDELIELFRKTAVYESHKSHFNFNEGTIEPIRAHMYVCDKLKTNPFNEWGLAHWTTVTPKRMGDKIYLIMKKNEKPLHFRDIAEHINNAGFDKKKAYAPTVHNELILDDRYVLVGRGIYALKEWGYIPGVVSDVIQNVLKGSSEPLSREDIVSRVLEQRMVKRGTVYLALSNNDRFAKDEQGRYFLALK